MKKLFYVFLLRYRNGLKTISNHFVLLTIAVLVFSFSNSGFAQTNGKKIGIALSGGGAKGIAHVGVLKVLEEAGIYPDIVTGTSMGSVVGGLYAIGYSSQELDSLARNLNWASYFSDKYDRSYRTIEEKDDEERYIFSFPLVNGKVKLPKGFVDGQKLAIMLSNLTQKIHGIDDFDDFKIPFRCIGTDLETGQAVVFDRGFLPDAIRGSISIPSVFEPLEIDGKLIVDGGISRNLPVQDAFDMGADIVIAVDVGALLFKKEELNSIFSVLDQTSSYQIAKSNRQQLNLASVVIRPDITSFSALNFNDIDSLILAGEVAAKTMLPQIRQLVGPQSVKSPLARKGISEELPKNVVISNIEVTGLNEKSRLTFLNILQIEKTKTYEIDKIDEQISRVIATGLFDKTNYQLVPAQDSFQLKIRATKTNDISLRVGANYHSTFNAGLLFNATIQNAFLQGSKFSLDIRVSENPALKVNYLVYTKTRPNIGFRINALASFHPGFLYLNSTLIDEYDFLKLKTRLDVFSGLGLNTSIGLGISSVFNRLDKRFFDLETRNPKSDQIIGHFNFNFDSFNRKYFSTSGAQLRLSGNLVLDGIISNTSDEGSEISNQYDTYNLFTYRQIFPLAPKFIMEWYNWAGYSKFKDPDFIQLFYLGRSLPYSERNIPFSGFNYMERPVGNFAFSGFKFQLEPKEDIFAALSFNYGIFQTPSFTYVDDNGFNFTPDQEDTMSGIGLEIGALSNFGPIRLTSEYNFGSEAFNFLFEIGFSF